MKSYSPEAAQAIVDKVVEKFLDEHVRLNRPEGGHEFLVEQAGTSRQKLQDVEQELCSLQTVTGLISADAQRDMMAQRISRMEEELLQTSRDVAASRARIKKLTETLELTERTEVTAELAGAANNGEDLMRQELYELEIKYEEMRSTYTETHPLVAQAKQQMEAAREVLSHEPETRTETTTTIGQAYQATELALLSERPVLVALEEKETQLRDQLAQARQELQTFNVNEVRVTELQREADLHDAVYRKYAATVEQARIDRALELERITNVNVAQPATFEAKPVSPRKQLNLALGLVIGLAGGVLLALVSDRLDESLHSPEDVEKNLDIPTLVAIPRLKSRDLVPTATSGNGNGSNGNGSDGNGSDGNGNGHKAAREDEDLTNVT
jgi:uncharacterized protein involved in exopolysaccharide biosynthesis